MPLSFRRRRDAARRRRAVLVVVLLAVAVAYAAAVSKSSPSSAPPNRILVVKAGTRTVVRLPTSRYVRAGEVDATALGATLASKLPESTTDTRGGTRTVYVYDGPATARRASRLGSAGGTVSAVRRPVATTIAAPVIAQRLRNNCEATALSILLATIGRRVDQLRIQRAFPTSGPVDPRAAAGTMTWGDPDDGFVGRADGGGAAGGFGVYPGPVRATAKRFGARLDDLSGRPASAVYRSLRSGHAVMAWIGLSDGPYGEWLSPAGRRINVNFGEHTVVLHGITRDGDLLVSNPLKGTRERWSSAQFELLWSRLGRRALATT